MSETATVLYDGDCSLCRSSVRWLRRLDWQRRLRFDDIREPATLARNPGVDAARAAERMHLIPPGSGAVLDGFHAFRWIAGRTPALWPLWPFLHLPGATRFGVRVYDVVARNRFAFAKCDADRCGLAPGDPGSETPLR